MQEKNITEIDPNFIQGESANSGLNYFDVTQTPGILEGLPFENPDGRRSRLPLETGLKMARHRKGPCMQTAGGLVRFRTDSPVIGFRLKIDEYVTGSNRRMSAGFDLYCGCGRESKFLGNHVMEKAESDHEFSWDVKNPEMRDYAVYLPIHCSFFKIELGIAPGSRLEQPAPHKKSAPIAFYGSSITNSGTCTRPGLLYPAVIGRMLDIESINLGFSGNCFGEFCVADQIAKLNLAVLILEYDHNAPDAEFLKRTHEPFFQYLRKLAPDLPVLMLSRADGDFSTENVQLRRAIVARTWLNAFEAGDRNVEFIDGETIYADDDIREDCTADCCHQNDIGQRLMAVRISDRLKRML